MPKKVKLSRAKFDSERSETLSVSKSEPSRRVNPLHDYDYVIPTELVAKTPAKPRDSAHLLVYDRKTKEVTVDTFRNLTHYLPPHSLLAMNQTKVIPARLTLTKPTGGRVTALFVAGTTITMEVLADKKLSLEQILTCGPYRLRVIKKNKNHFWLTVEDSGVKVLDIVHSQGQTPLPPYLDASSMSEAERRREYQTVFAKDPGSVAAPTASLHFTPALLKRIRAAGHDIAYVTLHVNQGTFAPVTQENLDRGHLHSEYFTIDKTAAIQINRARTSGQPIIAVGTTVARVLETVGQQQKIIATNGTTTLFIRPPYNFTTVNHLITNFHVPRSSLTMLVAALTGRKQLLTLYQYAIQQKLRFFSFGDAMLIR